MTAIEGCYEQGTPLHISNPQKSTFKILDYAEFCSLSAQALQEIFSEQNIVVTNYPCNKGDFDEVAMELIAAESKPITIHGGFFIPFCPLC